MKKQRKKSDMSSKLFGILNNINQNKHRIVKYFWLLYVLIIYYEYYRSIIDRQNDVGNRLLCKIDRTNYIKYRSA